MNIRTYRVYILALIFLLSLSGLVAQASAQDNMSNQRSGSPELPSDVDSANKATAASNPYTVLYNFCSDPECKDGGSPLGGLILDTAGNLYGTTNLGGYGGFDPGGAVFKVDATGRETVLYSFCSVVRNHLCADGHTPVAGVIRDAAGSLYGTTWLGGNDSANCDDGSCGTVFKVDSTGHETVLHSFCPQPNNCNDGNNPYAGLVSDAAGNLYGTTSGGGAGLYSGGTVFKVDSAGNYTVLYSFCSAPNCTDGAAPEASLILDDAGNLYGTTISGGTTNGGGTIFKLDEMGKETVLYNFCSAPNCTDGWFPESALVRDAAGNLYGTTSFGGANHSFFEDYGAGTAFKLDNTGKFTVLHSFCSAAGCKDGAWPNGLIQNPAGNFYGTTIRGGNPACGPSYLHGCGTVFELDSTGHETVLYRFCPEPNCLDGSDAAGLTLDSTGNLYGTTGDGGSTNWGTAFKLAPSDGVTLTSSPNPSVVNEPVTLTAVVAGTYVTPTGTVTFEKGKTILGTVTLANGQASLTTTFAKSGNSWVKASYSGDQIYQAANSRYLKQVVVAK